MEEKSLAPEGFQYTSKADERMAKASLDNVGHSLTTRTISKEDWSLNNMTLKVGPVDTGIPLSKSTASFLIGAGDQIADPARGIAQMLTNAGLVNAIDTDNQDYNEELLRQFYANPDRRLAKFTGAGLAAVMEPVGLLAPIGKAKTALGAITKGAAFGSAYGGTLYVDGDEKRLHNAVIGGLAGGTINRLMHPFLAEEVGSKVANRMKDLDDVARLEHLDGLYGKQNRLEFATGETPRYRVRPKPRMRVKATIAKREEDIIEETMEGIEAKAAMNGARHSKWQAFKDTADKVIRPIYDHMARYSPRIASGLRNADAVQHRMAKQWHDSVRPFNEFLQGLNPQQSQLVQKSLFTGLNTKTLALLEKLGGRDAVDSAIQVRAVLEDILKQYKAAGYKVNKLEDYFPRAVKDLDSLTKARQADIDRFISKTEKSKGRRLTQKERDAAIERYITNDRRFSNTAGQLKNRVIERPRDEQMEFYQDPTTALHYYIATAAEDLAKRRFFRGLGYKHDARKGLDITGADIDESIDAIVMKDTALGADDVNAVVNLLRARFSSDIHKTHKLVQGLKNMSYAATLGNPISAITQLGDIVFALHKYGIRDTVRSILGKNITTKEAMGIDKAMVEFNSQRSLTSKLADWAFKYGGFDAVDRFGKNVNLNAALRSNKKLAIKNPEKFRQRWGDTFGTEIDGVIQDLIDMKLTKDAKMSENVHLLLWNELADTQPIGLSEVPYHYLKNPNGRIFYAYKTFAVKQLNYMRNTMRREKNPFKKAYNLMSFATMFVLANTGTDMLKDFKDFYDGKDLKIEDKLVDNMLGLIGTSKYALDKGSGVRGVLEGIYYPPPVRQGVDFLGTITNPKKMGDLGGWDVAEELPVAGPLLKRLDARHWDGY